MGIASASLGHLPLKRQPQPWLNGCGCRYKERQIPYSLLKYWVNYPALEDGVSRANR